MQHRNGEQQYLDILEETYRYGGWYDSRNSRTKNVFDRRIDWGLDFPTSTIRPLGIKNAWEEMKLFLSGKNDTKILEAKGINFWKGNTSREFLDSRGLHDLPEGSLGEAYSHQFRSVPSMRGGDVDQFFELIYNLKFDPFSRRHSIDIWNVGAQSSMALPPCWYRSNWYCTSKHGKTYLNVRVDNRSLDILFGYYQAAMQYKLLQIALADVLGYEVGVMSTTHINLHIYENQMDYVGEMLERSRTLVPMKVTSDIKVDKDKAFSVLYAIYHILNVNWTVEDYNPNALNFNTPRPPMNA